MIFAHGFILAITMRLEARWAGMYAIMILGVMGTVPRAYAIELDDTRMLVAIEQREGYRGQPGASGELYRWQMMPATVADRGGYDEAAARRHLGWIKTQLGRARIDVLPFNVALVWNAGLTTVLQGRALIRHYRYADAVAALYDLPAGRSASSSVGVRDSSCGMSLAGIKLSTRVGCLERWNLKTVVGLVHPAAGLCARYFAPVLYTASAASLTEHYQIAALCSGAGVSPVVPGGLGLQMHDSPGAISCEVTGAVECRTGWPCRDNGQLSARRYRSGPSVCSRLAGSASGIGSPDCGTALPEAFGFHATAAMHRRMRSPLAEAVGVTLST